MNSFFFFFYVCILIYFPLATSSGQTVMWLMGSRLVINLLCLYYLTIFCQYDAMNFIRICFLATNKFGVLSDHQNSEVEAISL